MFSEREAIFKAFVGLFLHGLIFLTVRRNTLEISPCKNGRTIPTYGLTGLIATTTNQEPKLVLSQGWWLRNNEKRKKKRKEKMEKDLCSTKR